MDTLKEGNKKKKLKLHFIVVKSYFSPSLRIGNLSSYLKKRFKDILITLSWLKNDIFSEIVKISPDIIGLSCTSFHFTQFKQLAQKLSNKFNIPIIWGGPHITLAPLELSLSSDVGIIGEGEETTAELLENFVDGHFINLESIKGIVYRRNDEIQINEKRPLIKSLDDLPFPDWDLLEVPWDRFHRAAVLTSKRLSF